MNWHAINQHEFYAYDGQNRLGYVGYNATYGYWSWSVERTKECGTAGSKEDAMKAVEAAVEPLGDRR